MLPILQSEIRALVGKESIPDKDKVEYLSDDPAVQMHNDRELRRIYIPVAAARALEVEVEAPESVQNLKVLIGMK